MTEPNSTPTSEPTPRPRRRLPPHIANKIDPPDDDDDDDGLPNDDGQQQPEGEHQVERLPSPPQAAAMSVGEILLEMGRDPAWQRHFQKLQVEVDPLRSALHGRDLRRLARLGALPLRLVEGFARGADLSPGSRRLLARAASVSRRPSRPGRLTAWLRDGKLTLDDAARALGVAAQDVEAIAAGNVRLSTCAWQKLERLALGR